MTLIDAHVHVWDLTTGDYAWPDESVPEINRSIDLDEAMPEFDEAGVAGAVLVQAADTATETRRLLALSTASARVVGVVGWVPLERPDDVGADLREHRGRALVGIRSLIHTYPDPRWLLRPEVREGLALVAAEGLAYDVVTASPAGLDLVPAIGEHHSTMRIVIDHLGKPPVGGGDGERRRWRARLARAAENPLVSAKLSGLYPAQGSLAAWTPDMLRPFVDDALEVFGPSRLMFGSDWPVSLLAGGYRRTWDAVSRVLASASDADRTRILGGTAAEIYRISPSRMRAAEEETS